MHTIVMYDRYVRVLGSSASLDWVMHTIVMYDRNVRVLGSSASTRTSRSTLSSSHPVKGV